MAARRLWLAELKALIPADQVPRLERGDDEFHALLAASLARGNRGNDFAKVGQAADRAAMMMVSIREIHLALRRFRTAAGAPGA